MPAGYWSTLTDSALEPFFAAGVREACEEVVIRHMEEVQEFLLDILRDKFKAEDCLQETFSAASVKCRSYKPGGNLMAWLFKIARNKAMDLFRQEKRAQGLLNRIESDEARAKTPETFIKVTHNRTKVAALMPGRLTRLEASAELSKTQNSLLSCIRAYTRNHRDCKILTGIYLSLKTPEELADEFFCPSVNIRNLKMRFRKKYMGTLVELGLDEF